MKVLNISSVTLQENRFKDGLSETKRKQKLDIFNLPKINEGPQRIQ